MGKTLQSGNHTGSDAIFKDVKQRFQGESLGIKAIQSFRNAQYVRVPRLSKCDFEVGRMIDVRSTPTQPAN